jgi:hypothetical protein
MKKNIKGLKATRIPAQTVHAAKVHELARELAKEPEILDEVNAAKARVWQAGSEVERLQVAQETVWRIFYWTAQCTSKMEAVVLVVAGEILWSDYVKEHLACVQGTPGPQFEMTPTVLWYRQIFADQVRNRIVAKDPDTLAGFVSRKWGHPMALLEPEKFASKDQTVIAIPRPQVEFVD